MWPLVAMLKTHQPHRWGLILLWVGVFLLVGGKAWLDGKPLKLGWRWYLIVVAVAMLLQAIIGTD